MPCHIGGKVVMNWGDSVYRAIEQRDAAALCRMAEEADREETRMFLNLLADLVGRQSKKSTSLKKTA